LFESSCYIFPLSFPHMFLELMSSYKFQYFFYSKNPYINNLIVCFDYNPNFSPPFSCINPTHVASSSSYIDLVHVASSSCVGPVHLTLSNYVDLSNVASSTIVPNPKGKINKMLMMLQSFPSLLIQYQRNKIMITLGNFEIHGLLNYLGQKCVWGQMVFT